MIIRITAADPGPLTNPVRVYEWHDGTVTVDALDIDADHRRAVDALDIDADQRRAETPLRRTFYPHATVEIDYEL